MNLQLRPMTVDDYESVSDVWLETEGIFLADADTVEGLGKYLARNPATSFVALVDGAVVGAILCGHDGRRASMHHLAVTANHRGCGIGRLLVTKCMEALTEEEISCSYIFILNTNGDTISFWHHLGWDVQANFAAFKRCN